MCAFACASMGMCQRVAAARIHGFALLCGDHAKNPIISHTPDALPGAVDLLKERHYMLRPDGDNGDNGDNGDCGSSSLPRESSSDCSSSEDPSESESSSYSSGLDLCNIS